MSDKKKTSDIYRLKRKLQRDKRALRKKALGIEDDHSDTSMQRTYGIATKTRRALKVELFGSKTKASGTGGKETSLESFVRNFLEEKGIEYIEQKAISFINVDFYIPEFELAIECAGEYWHCDPRVYPEPKNQTQRKNIEKDKRSKEIVLNNKKKLLVIWENEIKNEPDLTLENLNRIFSGDIKEVEYSSEW